MKQFFSTTSFLFIALTVALMSITTRATSQFIDFQPNTVEDTTSARNGLLMTYQLLLGSEMKDVYGGMMGVHFERVSWEWERVGIRYGGGVVGGQGSGIVVNHSWNITTREIGFWALDLEASLVYRFTAENPFKHVTPFMGLGLDLIGGTEKFSIIMDSANYTASVRGDASALRGTIAVHGIIGVYLPIAQDNAIQVEAKFLFSPQSGYKDILSEDQKSIFENKIYTVVKRPSFNVTGINLGLAFFL